ncbi:MAG: DUF6443 domain-containing protein [Cyclobacteriaceae bacterium]
MRQILTIKVFATIVLMLSSIALTAKTPPPSCGAQIHCVGDCGPNTTLQVKIGGQIYEDDAVSYWWFEGGSTSSISNASFLQVSVSSATTYRVEVEVMGHDQLSDCFQDENLSVTVGPLPPPPSGIPGEVCGLGDVTVKVQNPGSGTYRWFFNSNATNPVPDNGDPYNIGGPGNSELTIEQLASSRDFYVREENEFGNSQATPVYAEVHTPTQVNAGPNIIECSRAGSPHVVQLNQGVSHSGGTWSSTNSIAQAAINLSNWEINMNSLALDTDYELRYSYVDSNECPDDDTKIVRRKSLTPEPVVIGDRTGCVGEMLQLVINGEDPNSDGNHGFYEWYDQASGGTPFSISTSIDTLAGSIVWVTATVSNNCTSIRHQVVTVIASDEQKPNTTGGYSCGEGEVTLSVNQPNGTYQWFFDEDANNPIPTGTSTYRFEGTGNSEMTVNLTTTTPFYVRKFSSQGCHSGTQPVTGIIYTPPVVSAGSPLSICNDLSVSEINLDTLGVSPLGTGGIWSSSDPLVEDRINKEEHKISLGGLSLDVAHVLKYTYTDTNGCYKSDTRTLTVKAKTAEPDYTGPTSGCTDQMLRLVILGEEENSEPVNGEYKWFNDLGVLVSANTFYDVLAGETVWVSATGPNNCESLKRQITTTITSNEDAPELDDVTRCGPGDVTFSIFMPSGSYEWFFDSQGNNPLPTTDSEGYSYGTSNATLTAYLTEDQSFWVRKKSDLGCHSQLVGVTGYVEPFNAGADMKICENSGAVSLVSFGTATIAGAVWSSSDPTINAAIDNQNQTLNTDVIDVGIYTLTLSSPLEGCTSGKNVEVGRTQEVLTTVNGGLTTVGLCSDGGLAQLTPDEPNPDPATSPYRWYDTASGDEYNYFSSDLTLDVLTVENTTVWLAVEFNGCFSPRAPIQIVLGSGIAIPIKPMVHITTSPYTVTVSQSNVSTSEVTYYWQRSANSKSDDLADMSISNPASGFYFIRGINDEGCWSAASEGVEVINHSPKTMTIAINELNYVRTYDYREPSESETVTYPLDIGDETNPYKLRTATNYVDGLGRPVQQVQRMGSFGEFDVNVPTEYDPAGRVVRSYLPYVTTKNDGLFSANPVVEQRDYYSFSGTTNVPTYFPFAYSHYEKSPAGFVTDQSAPGEDWMLVDELTTNMAVNFSRAPNLPSDNVLLWQIGDNGMPANGIDSHMFYDDGELIRVTTTDEENNQTIEFIDKLGQTILKRSETGDPIDSWAETYYIYDDLSRLRFVIPPQPTQLLLADLSQLNQTFLDLWVFQYEYDGRNRMISKKVPGAEKVVMVYDRWDRLVLTQDGDQREVNTNEREWLFTKYDSWNRPIVTGQLTTAVGPTSFQEDLEAIRTAVMNSSGRNESYDETMMGETQYTTNSSFPNDTEGTEREYLTVTYYDNYKFIPGSDLAGTSYSRPSEFDGDGVDNYHLLPDDIVDPKGQVTGIKTRILGTLDFIESITYYDHRYRVIQVISENHLVQDGIDIISNQYDFVGNVRRIKNVHNGVDQTVTLLEYEYDHANRLTEGYHTFNTGQPVHLFSNKYNELGELEKKQLHGSGTSFRQSIDYAYNIRGWLRSINESGLSGNNQIQEPDDLFSMELLYNTTNPNIPTDN